MPLSEREHIVTWNPTDKRRKTTKGVQTGGTGSEYAIPSLGSDGRLHPTMMPLGVGADIKVVTASGGLAAGDVVNLFYEASTLKARKADGGANRYRADGYVLNAYTDGQATVEVWFEAINNAMSGLTPGEEYFLSAVTPGTVTDTPPSGSGHIVQRIGVALSATELAWEPSDEIELA